MVQRLLQHVVIVVLLCACSKPAPSPKLPERAAKSLVRTEPLPEHVLDVLQKLMMAHGEEADHLFWSALMFDYEGVEAVATSMALRRQRATPEAGAVEALSAHLPEQFFILQNEFESAALSLADAAKKRDDQGIARFYGELMSTCVGCHAVYMKYPLRLTPGK